MADLPWHSTLIWDREPVPVLRIRSPHDQRVTLERLATDREHFCRSIVFVHSMRSVHRRRLIQAIEDLELSVRPARRRDLRQSVLPGQSETPPHLVALLAVNLVVFGVPALLVQMTGRLFGRGYRVFFVETLGGNGAQPPGGGVREPAGPFPATPSEALAGQPPTAEDR